MSQDNETTRKRRRKSRKKKSGGRGCLFGCLTAILILVAAGLAVAFFAYREVQNTTDEMYSPIGEDHVVHESREEPVDISREQPFSVLLMGIDTGEYGRVEQGRSDTMMVSAINPNTEQTTLVSIPRDTYTEIIGRGTMDKINHAYAFGGTSMAVNTVQNLFNIPIDYYVSVNMQGLAQIVDALGGITLNPVTTFSQGDYSFVEGQPTQLDGNMALEYSRMRYQDPAGDYGRQARQRQVVQAIINSLASVDSIMNYQNVLQVLEGNMETNMTFGEMVNVFGDYRGAADNIEEVQMSGSGTMMNGIYYDIIPDSELARVQSILQQRLEIE